ncbi:HTH domain [Listeria grayi]|uniref:HTH domain n=1 Tax=Listeria grayi TaxID=1641 RepID=A0A378MBH2_LISGR|nr:HTH domain [Listeria grayi]
MLKENQYTLLKLLLNEHEYQSAEYFAAGLDVSTKTIQNYLQQMEPYFAAHQYQLLRKRGRRLKLLSTAKRTDQKQKWKRFIKIRHRFAGKNSNFFALQF